MTYGLYEAADLLRKEQRENDYPTHRWITGDALAVMREMNAGSVDLVLADPPYGEFPLVNEAIAEARRVSRGASLFFMYGEDLCHLAESPQQVLYWVKPISTKNTSKRYSRFVEVIAVYDIGELRQDTHWSNRTGVFTEACVLKTIHPFQKPDQLYERLIRNHVGPKATVLDPFAGSGTLHRVAPRLGINSISIEIESAA